MRKNVLTLLVVCLAVFVLTTSWRNVSAAPKGLDASPIFNDPAAPVTGNPKGDLTIVEFSDYNCPFCKRSAEALARLVQEDGGIRVIHKDWPVLTEASVYGARLALAAGYQGRYATAHTALMRIPGMKIPESAMRQAVAASGVDMDRLEGDLKAHGADITGLLDRNAEQAESLGLQGTPAFLVGPYIVPSALDYDGFKQVVADARHKRKAN